MVFDAAGWADSTLGEVGVSAAELRTPHFSGPGLELELRVQLLGTSASPLCDLFYLGGSGGQ